MLFVLSGSTVDSIQSAKLCLLEHYHVFVGDVSPDIESHQLREAFAPFGQISYVSVFQLYEYIFKYWVYCGTFLPWPLLNERRRYCNTRHHTVTLCVCPPISLSGKGDVLFSLFCCHMFVVEVIDGHWRCLVYVIALTLLVGDLKAIWAVKKP